MVWLLFCRLDGVLDRTIWKVQIFIRFVSLIGTYGKCGWNS